MKARIVEGCGGCAEGRGGAEGGVHRVVEVVPSVCGLGL